MLSLTLFKLGILFIDNVQTPFSSYYFAVGRTFFLKMLLLSYDSIFLSDICQF